ncbi:hypothetical protein HanHA300_Chr16g0597571 [Helianthus annuus]|nr:hypothetical protein HanHA300_Chr16g0597571 [Helianthus annuus]KAJ0459357.1 hypothetical protein HanHA89_Chr16g0648041 [Helianthus annuus]
MVVLRPFAKLSILGKCDDDYRKIIIYTDIGVNNNNYYHSWYLLLKLYNIKLFLSKYRCST